MIPSHSTNEEIFMQPNIPFKFIRQPEVLVITGLSKSTIYNKINAQEMCPPISLGARAVGFIYSEVIAVVKAMISGKSQAEIKALVQELLAQRQQLSFQ